MLNKLKFLHFGDLHLDMPFTSIGAEATLPDIRRQELKECFDRIIGLAKDEKVDIILVSGDLFEHSYVRKSTINHINESFKSIRGIEVFISPGNHDPFLEDSYYKGFDWSDNVHIFGSGRNSFELNRCGACIYGAGFGNFYERKSLVSEIRAENRELINILLVHGTVDMLIGGGEYNPMTSGMLDTTGMDYVALGHFHNRIEGGGSRGIIYNPGSPEPLGFDEPGEHGIFIGTITKEGESRSKQDIRFVKTAKRYYETLSVDAGSCSTNEQIAERISSALAGEALKNGLFDISLKGYVNRGFIPDLARIKKLLAGGVFYLKLRDETSEDFEIDEIVNEPGIRGLFVRKLLLLIEKEKDEEKIKLYRNALHFGLQALESGEVEIY